MINPGGSPGTSFSKSAMTRFNNGQTNAMRSQMPFNAAAQQSLRNKYSSGNKKGGPPVVGRSNPPSAADFLGREPQQQSVDVPTGGPQLPEQDTQAFDPAVFVEQQIDQLVEKIQMDKFLESPRVKDATTLAIVKEGLNPGLDQRDLFSRIVERLSK